MESPKWLFTLQISPMVILCRYFDKKPTFYKNNLKFLTWPIKAKMNSGKNQIRIPKFWPWNSIGQPEWSWKCGKNIVGKFKNLSPQLSNVVWYRGYIKDLRKRWLILFITHSFINSTSLMVYLPTLLLTSTSFLSALQKTQPFFIHLYQKNFNKFVRSKGIVRK